MAAGLSAHEIADLHVTAITMDRGHLLVTVHRHGVTWNAVLPTDLGARLLAWITERRPLGRPRPALHKSPETALAGRHPPGPPSLPEAAEGPRMTCRAVNPLELLTWWEGRGGRRPLSLRELAGKLGVSEATVRKHLRTLRAAGKVDDAVRSRALATRGGLPKGGRPANPLDDEDLLALWRKTPSPSAVARHLGVSRNRVQARLRDLGLLPATPASDD
ncbi:MAG TPA: helix-turn-helix domain-containing protein [Thermoanaerobaculia bacterium]|nr:helix-turn-helix domain-containing protein [Thermoanaerobaculia bacterium]